VWTNKESAFNVFLSKNVLVGIEEHKNTENNSKKDHTVTLERLLYLTG